MKISLLILIMLSSATSCFAQISVKGKVRDRQQNLPSATVLLLRPDSTLVKGAVTDTTGAFVFENVISGHYVVSSAMMGYAKQSQLISVAESAISLPDMILEQSSTQFDEITIKTTKPMFEQQIDRLVMNIQGSVTSAGNTVLEVLQKSPGVVVNKQNNTIAMNGKTGVLIMVNDKLMQVPIDVAVQMLDGMNASNVERIELIHTPPARYDAEGNAGIIHIVTKGNRDFGTNGSFGLTAGTRWAEALGFNVNLSHRNEKIAYFLDYAILRNHNLHELKTATHSMYGQLAQTVSDESHRENLTTQQNLNAGLEWKLNKNTSLNAGLTGYRRNWDLTASTNGAFRVSSDSTSSSKLEITESNIWQSITGAVGLQTKINAKSEVNVSFDYLYYHNDNPSGYDTKVFGQSGNVREVYKIDLAKKTPIHFIIAKADYLYAWSPAFTIETGVKGVTSKLANNVLVRREVNHIWTDDPDFTSFSDLDEQVGGAYVSTKWQPGGRWQVNSGLRYEYTHTTISTPTQKNLINRKYGYFFPSIFLKKDLGAEEDFQVSYARRITRPTYNDIAPYVFFWGTNSFSAGNTTLLPAISDAIKVGYHSKAWVISMHISHSKNDISYLQPEYDSHSNSIIYRSQNMKYVNSAGLTTSYALNPTSWWNVQSSVTAQYQITQTAHLPENTKLTRYMMNLNVVNVVKLPNGFSVEISGIYQSRTLSGITQYLPQGSLNAGIQKKFGEKGTLALSVDDMLNTNNWRIKTYLPGNNLDTYFGYKWHNRYVRLTYNRNIGNHKLRSIQLKSGAAEERSRVGN